MCFVEIAGVPVTAATVELGGTADQCPLWTGMPPVVPGGGQ